MRTISVREAAAALGITPRAVTYRLEKGQLKGTLDENDNGVPEWHIYPNKEILNGLKQAAAVLSSLSKTGPDKTSEIDFQPNDNDVVDAESVEAAGESSGTSQQANDQATQFHSIVEQCVRPLVEEVKAQTLAIAERDKIIEDQGRQLRLLPDLQKRAEEEKARAEQERNVAELKHVETEALKKQIDLLQASTVPKNQVDELEQQIAQLEREKVEAEQSRQKVEELERTLSENKRLADEELERLRKEKDAQAEAIQEQLQLITSKLEKSQEPWWKKWFTAGGDDKTT